MGLRERMTLLRRAAVLAWAVGLLWAPPALAVISIDFSPPAQSVDLGPPAMVDIVISGLGNMTSPSLGDFDLNVTFDPAILAPTGVIFGSFLGDPVLDALTGVIFSPGVVNLAELSFLSPLDLDALQPASFPLATLTFDTLAAGVSALGPQINALGDENGFPLLASLGTGSITVLPPTPGVPEPGTLLLLGLGLAGVGVRSWRRGARRR